MGRGERQTESTPGVGPGAETRQRHGLRAVVDAELCVGFAECVQAAPSVFRLDDENVAVVLDPESADAETLRNAAEACPVDAITLYDADGRQVWPQK